MSDLKTHYIIINNKTRTVFGNPFFDKEEAEKYLKESGLVKEWVVEMRSNF
jgi:hypothetical protein